MSTEGVVQVGVTPRRDVVLKSALAGLIAGLLLIGVTRLVATTPVALGTRFELAQPVDPWLFWHLLFSGVFGALFGVLVHSRPMWRYGRGFLGPVVGAVFGVLVWATVAAVVTPAWGALHGLTTFGAVPAVREVAVGTYVVYGGVVGLLANVFP